jgi:outer membrane lipoprotein-sorting protein
MISKLSLLSLVLVANASAQTGPLAPPEVKALLDKIRARRAGAPQVQADFQEEKTVHLMNKPISSAGKVWFQKPNKFRREVRGSSPSFTVSDGQELWIYYPKFQSAERYSLGKHSPLDAGIAALTAALNLENVENSYHIAASRQDTGYELQLAPRNPSLKRLLKTFDIWMNPDLQVQRTEMVQPNGDHIVTLYSNESRAPIPPATFEFTPPAGTAVTTPLGR